MSDILPYAQLISDRFENTSCFKVKKNVKLHEKYYITDIEEEMDMYTDGTIVVWVKLYDTKKDEDRYEKCNLYISDRKIMMDINIDASNSKEVKESIVNIFETFTDIKFSLPKVKNTIGNFFIPGFTMNIPLITDEIMLNPLINRLFYINEISRSSLDNPNRLNVIFSSDLLEKHSDKFKAYILLQKRETWADADKLDQKIIPGGSYYMNIEVKGKDIRNIDYFITLFKSICSLYKFNEESLAEEYGALLCSKGKKECSGECEWVDDECRFKTKYEYKPIKFKKSIAESKHLGLGSSRKCSNRPDKIDDTSLIRKIDYTDETEKCIYGILGDKDDGSISESEYTDLGTDGVKRVMKYPKDDSGEFFACPREKGKQTNVFPGLYNDKENNTFIPCCYTKVNKSCENYYKNITVKSSKASGLITTNKILEPTQSGYVPHNIDIFLRTYQGYDVDIFRRGVNRSPYSFLECILRVKGIPDIKNELMKIQDTKFLNEIIRQECYNLSIDEIRGILLSNKYLNPRLFVHLFELIYGCNIVIFQRNDNVGEFILPNHHYGYYKLNRSSKPIICILEHMGTEKDRGSNIPQCELIYHTGGDEKFHFNKTIMKKYDTVLTTKISGMVSDKFRLSPQFYKTIVSQGFCSFGKTRFYVCKYKDELVEVFTTPLPPLQLQSSKFTGFTYEKDMAIDFFKEFDIELHAETKNSVIGKYRNILFAIKVNNPGGEDKTLFNRFTNTFNIDNVSVLKTYRDNKRISRCLFDYVKFSFSRFLDRKPPTIGLFDEFSKKYIEVNMDFEYSLPPIQIESSEFGKDDKIYLTSDTLLERIVYNMKLIISSNPQEITVFKNHKVYPNYYINISDFEVNQDEFISGGKDNYEIVMNSKINNV